MWFRSEGWERKNLQASVGLLGMTYPTMQDMAKCDLRTFNLTYTGHLSIISHADVLTTLLTQENLPFMGVGQGSTGLTEYGSPTLLWTACGSSE